jgi:hypothetical protein
MANVQFLHGLKLNRVPTAAELDMIPLARAGEFELNEKEIRQTRTEIYKINHDGIRRFRTLREGPLLMVWRIK